ncbi:MAG: hypothetical protein OXH00_25925 [Candidatus Poribacteria bacterium]|nr:hypothetical protein [Candidatus Poribacteria bacterium]
MIRGGIVGGLYGNRGGGGGNNPVSYYFGKNQTKQFGGHYTPAGTGNQRAAEFKTTADRILDGGKNDLLSITHASAEADIDIGSGPNNSVLLFPEGRYHLCFQGYVNATTTTFRVDLKKINTGTDDIVLASTPGYSSAAAPIRTTFELIYMDFEPDGTEKFYFFFPANGSSPRSHFLRVEKVA